MKKRDTKKILVLILLFGFLVELLELYRPSIFVNWHYEKCEKYTIIKEVSEGRGYDFLQYVDVPLISYTIFHTYLAMPFYYIFHSPFLAYISVNLIFSLFMVAAIFLFLSKFFNLRAAIIGSFFLLFSNPLITPVFIDGYPFSHFFGFLALLFFSFFQKKKQRIFAIIGLLVGVSTLFHYTGLIYFFSIVISWFVFDKKFLLKKEFGVFLMFFLVGISFEFFIEFRKNFTYGFKRFTSERVEHAFEGHSLFEIQRNIPQRLTEIFHILSSFPVFFLPTFLLPILSLFFLKLKKRKLLETPLAILIILSLSFLIFTYILPFYVMNYLQVYFSLMNAILFSKLISSRGYKKFFSLLILAIVLGIYVFNELFSLFYVVALHDRFPIFVYLPFITECYDAISYDIVGNDFRFFSENCDKFGEYKYYCYRAAGQIIGRNVWNLSLAKEYCDRLKFKEWCYEGLYEEIGYHTLGNLSVVKEIELYHYDNEKWKHLYLPEHFKELSPENLKVDLKNCEQVPEEYKKECYEGLGKVWSTYNTHAPEEKIGKVCDYLEDPYKTYCYVGSFNIINEELPPYALDCKNTCNYEYACYEGASEKIAFRYSDPLTASLACEYISKNNEEFKNICYNKIGYFLADRFMYNLSKAFEYCKMVKESSACNEGIRNFLEKRKILTTSPGRSCYRIEKDDLLVNEQTKLCNEIYELWDSNFNGAIVVSGSNFVLDCNGSSLTEDLSKISWYVRLSNKVVNFAKGISNAQTIGIKIENANNFTLTNCKIMGFDLGILIKNSTNIKIKDSFVGFGGRGIVVEKTKNLTLINTTLRNMSLHGLHFLGSTGLLVENSSFEEVKKWECILIRNSRDVTIEKNKFLSSEVGICIEDFSSNIRIENNVFKDMRYCFSTEAPSLENVYMENNSFECKSFS